MVWVIMASQTLSLSVFVTSAVEKNLMPFLRWILYARQWVHWPEHDVVVEDVPGRDGKRPVSL
jgi:hypothetical protein